MISLFCKVCKIGYNKLLKRLSDNKTYPDCACYWDIENNFDDSTLAKIILYYNVTFYSEETIQENEKFIVYKIEL